MDKKNTVVTGCHSDLCPREVCWHAPNYMDGGAITEVEIE